MLGPRDGKETVILEDEDMVDWHFRANNTKHRKLWGVYVYLKGYGHVWCDDTYLAPGETTDCRAADEVWTGEQTADAWATEPWGGRSTGASARLETFGHLGRGSVYSRLELQRIADHLRSDHAL